MWIESDFFFAVSWSFWCELRIFFVVVCRMREREGEVGTCVVVVMCEG